MRSAIPSTSAAKGLEKRVKQLEQEIKSLNSSQPRTKEAASTKKAPQEPGGKKKSGSTIAPRIAPARSA